MNPLYSIIPILILLLPLHTASGQWVVFNVDRENLAKQSTLLRQMVEQLTQSREHLQIARAARDAARRRITQYDAFMREADRLLPRRGKDFLHDLNAPLRGNGVVSYLMTQEQWQAAWAMEEAPPSKTYQRDVNRRTMTTITATMAAMQKQQRSLDETTGKLQELSTRLRSARNPDERRDLQSQIGLIRAQMRAQKAQLLMTRSSLEAVMNAQSTDAAAQGQWRTEATRQLLKEDIRRAEAAPKRNFLAPRRREN